MRNRILFAVLGVAIAGLALSGLLGVLELFPTTKPSAAVYVVPPNTNATGENPGNLPKNLPGFSPNLTPVTTDTTSPAKAPSNGLLSTLPTAVCPVCQGKRNQGSGLCSICNGTGKSGIGLQKMAAIFPEGGLGSRIPLFKINGAANTPLLRSIVTSSYDGTAWYMDPEANSYLYTGENIKPPVTGYNRQVTDEIKVTSIQKIPSTEMTLPTSLYPVSVSSTVPLNYFPSELQFISNQELPENYSFKAVHFDFAKNKLSEAEIDSDNKYLQVPSNTSERVKELANNITDNIHGPYKKAQAIENYLESNYEYNLDYQPAPPGREPNDWFLFEEKKGVCSNFNSAFVLLSRMAGISSRLVDGYKINPEAGDQVVYASQAHAWSEIKLKDLGWITFDATGKGPGALATTTGITAVTTPILKGQKFNVQGTVLDSDNKPVNGVPVELFISPQKDISGGITVGKGKVDNGVFNITAIVPAEAKVGQYQLMAHSLGGIKYLDSWSDPPVIVLTGTNIALKAPEKIKISGQLMLKGILTEDSSKPVSGQEVDIYLGEKLITRLNTDENGQFVIWQSFDITGDYSLKAIFPGSDYFLKSSQEVRFQVLTPTLLSLRGPQKANLKQPLSMEGSLSEEISGLAFPNQKIDVMVDGLPLKETVMTDTAGTFSFKHSFNREGFHNVEARYSGVPYYFESVAETEVEILPDINQPGFNWTLPIVVLLVAVLFISVYFLSHRLKRKPPIPGSLTAGDVSEMIEAPDEDHEDYTGQYNLSIEFPDIEPPLADVWGVGDALRVVCNLKSTNGIPPGSQQIDFLVGKTISHITSDVNGSGLLECTFQKKGQYQLTARYGGESGQEQVSARRPIKIVDYREEIVDLFRSLLEWFRNKGLDLPPKATPREIQQVLTKADKVIPAAALEKVIIGFEEADYSLHTIERESYKVMYLAQKEIRDHEPTPPVTR